MKAGDRVGFIEPGIRGEQLGTIESVSPKGYVRVIWGDGRPGYFTPVTAKERLIVKEPE